MITYWISLCVVWHIFCKKIQKVDSYHENTGYAPLNILIVLNSQAGLTSLSTYCVHECYLSPLLLLLGIIYAGMFYFFIEINSYLVNVELKKLSVSQAIFMLQTVVGIHVGSQLPCLWTTFMRHSYDIGEKQILSPLHCELLVHTLVKLNVSIDT